jgi:hypothetical protein
VHAVAEDRYVAEAYAPRLGKAKVGKSSISFKRLTDIDADALREVVRIAARQITS